METAAWTCWWLTSVAWWIVGGCEPSGVWARSSVSAAATLARIMNSSISRWASSRCGVTTRSIVPSGLSRILRFALSGPMTPNQDNSRGPMTFWGAAMFQWVNAKGWVMVIGTITAYAAIAAYPWNIAIQVGLSLLLGILSCTAWALFGTALRPVLTSRRAVRAFNIVMAVLLLASLYPVFMDA